MKWTVLPLIAAALIVYGLLFAVHAVRDNQDRSVQGTDTDSDPLRIVARPAEATELVTDIAPAQVEEPELEVLATETGPVEEDAPELEPREWEGGAWAAGCRAFEERDYLTANQALQDAVREDETKAGRHYLLGLTQLKLGLAESAAGELERSVSLDPTRIRPYVHLGRAYLELEDSITAREVIDAALELQLDYADAWQVLGRIELSEQNHEGAEAAFTKASELDQEHAWAFNNIGYVRILEQRFAEAVEPINRAIVLNEEVASFHNNLGVALERSGDLQGALSAYEFALEIGHPTALRSAERVEAVIVAQGLLSPETVEEPRLAAAPADTATAGAW